MSDPDIAKRFSLLTDEQMQVVRMVAEHMSSKEIARELDRSPSAIDQRLDRACAKLGVAGRNEAARLLIRYERHSENRPIETYDKTTREDSHLPQTAFYSDEGVSVDELSPPADNGRMSLHEQQAFDYNSYVHDQGKSPLLSALFGLERKNRLSTGQRAMVVLVATVLLLMALAMVLSLHEGMSRLFSQ